MSRRLKDTLERRRNKIGRQGVTKEEVSNAVCAVRSQGLPTTTRVLRLELGKGSYSSIGKLLEELGAKSDGKRPQTDEMPQDLQRRLADCLLSMWQSASKAAAAGASRLSAQCDERVRIVSAQLACERAARECAEAELCSIQGEHSSCRARKLLLEEEVRMLREQLRVEHALLERSERECSQVLKRLGPIAPSASKTVARRSTAGRGRAAGHEVRHS